MFVTPLRFYEEMFYGLIKSFEVLQNREEEILCYLDDLYDFFEVEWVNHVIAFLVDFKGYLRYKTIFCNKVAALDV